MKNEGDDNFRKEGRKIFLTGHFYSRIGKMAKKQEKTDIFM